MKKREFRLPENQISADVLEVAYRIHTEVGPGLLEGAYLQSFCYLLRKKGRKVETEVSVPIEFDGLKVATGFRADVVVDDLVIVELKSVKAIEDVFLKQLLTYVRLCAKRLGILINFGAESLDGQIRRVAVGLPEE